MNDSPISNEHLSWCALVAEDLAKMEGGGNTIHFRSHKAIGILFAEIERLEKLLSPEPRADAEKLLEAYDAAWIEDERLADRSRSPDPASLKAIRERFNNARTAVLTALRFTAKDVKDAYEDGYAAGTGAARYRPAEPPSVHQAACALVDACEREGVVGGVLHNGLGWTVTAARSAETKHGYRTPAEIGASLSPERRAMVDEAAKQVREDYGRADETSAHHEHWCGSVSDPLDERSRPGQCTCKTRTHCCYGGSFGRLAACATCGNP